MIMICLGYSLLLKIEIKVYLVMFCLMKMFKHVMFKIIGLWQIRYLNPSHSSPMRYL